LFDLAGKLGIGKKDIFEKGYISSILKKAKLSFCKIYQKLVLTSSTQNFRESFQLNS